MIDPLQLFPKLDAEQGVETHQQKPLGAPVSSELKKDVPVFLLSSNKPNENVDVRPNPMAMMRDGNSSLVDPEVAEDLKSAEFEEQVRNLKERLWDAQSVVQSKSQEHLSQEHLEAMDVIMDLINGDLSNIAEHTRQDMLKNKKDSGESVTRKVIDWVSSGEEILNRALLYFSDRNGEPESLAEFLKVQYAVQRATQRAELFASIVGTTVSSIKTIMTTQLG